MVYLLISISIPWSSFPSPLEPALASPHPRRSCWGRLMTNFSILCLSLLLLLTELACSQCLPPHAASRSLLLFRACTCPMNTRWPLGGGWGRRLQVVPHAHSAPILLLILYAFVHLQCFISTVQSSNSVLGEGQRMWHNTHEVLKARHVLEEF